jgi:hypothetical protein
MISLATKVLITALATASWLSIPADAAYTSHYLCTQSGKRSFSETSKAPSCLTLHDEPGWADLMSNPEVIVSYHPSSVVRDGDTVKAWVQIYLATPVSGDKGHVQYDSVRASYKFYCRSRQQLLIQGTYKLGETRVHERPSSDSVMEEIEPDTIADTLLNLFCDGSSDPAAPSRSASSSFDAMFVCPEFLPNNSARDGQLRRFVQWMAAVHPELNTVRDLVTMRVKLLKAHHCEATLESIGQHG